MAANKFSNRNPTRQNTRREFLRDGTWGLTNLKEHKAGAVVFKSGRFDIILERG